MVEVGDHVWFFDETAMHHDATVTKVNKDDTINVEYIYKGTKTKERDIPHKDYTEVNDIHPTQKINGKPREWNTKTLCWKEKPVKE